MTTIIIDENSKDGKELIKYLRTKKFATILDNKIDEDWWDTISEEEKLAIEEGLSDINKGKTYTQEEVFKQYAKWL